MNARMDSFVQQNHWKKDKHCTKNNEDNAMTQLFDQFFLFKSKQFQDSGQQTLEETLDHFVNSLGEGKTKGEQQV